MGPAPEPASAPVHTFRRDIEGLHAVAVVLVVLLHAGVTVVSGGYIGVDVFFVISGYLITSLLLDEVRTSGRISILGFYARRARRILPAACFVIAVTVVATYLQLGPLSGKATAIDGRWAAGFSANVRFIRQGTNYFASSLPPSPLQHFWSLAVEEQFYVVWPTLLFGLVALGRRLAKSTATMQIGILAVVAASLYWSIHQSTASPTTAYFSPFTRAWELGAGAVIAVFPAAIVRVSPGIRAAATWIGLALVGVAAFTFTASTVFPGYTALLPVIGTALVIAGGIGAPRATAGVILGVAPMRWLGRISYSLYLWHWPVLIIAEERSATPLSNVARIVCVIVSVVLSAASFYAIERPLRATGVRRVRTGSTNWQKARRSILIGVVAIAVAVAATTVTNARAGYAIDQAAQAADKRRASLPNSSLVPNASLNTQQQVAAFEQQVRALVQQGLALHKVSPDVDPPVLQISTTFDPRFSRCLQGTDEVTVRTCTFGSTSSTRTLLVLGDSHAMQWMPALDIYGKQAGYRVVTLYKGACPTPSVNVLVGDARTPFPQCTAWRNNALRYVDSTKPDVVVIAFSTANTSAHGEGDLDLWTSGLVASLNAIKSSGAQIVEIGNNTHLPQDPGLCLSHPNADPSNCASGFSDRARVDKELAAVRAAGDSFIDIEPWFCADNRCPVIIDNRIAYANNGHLSAQYVTDLEPLLAATLKSYGLR